MYLFTHYYNFKFTIKCLKLYNTTPTNYRVVQIRANICLLIMAAKNQQGRKIKNKWRYQTSNELFEVKVLIFKSY